MEAQATSKYGFGKVVDMSFEDALEKTKAALMEQGFGILTEIDVKATLKKKIGVDFPKYQILGACNPPLAHKAMTEEPEIGLLLPCNVLVKEANGKVEVSVVDAAAMMSFTGNEALAPVAKEAGEKLGKALAAI